MPLPQYHLGPGLLLKGIGGARFSLTVFLLAQVLMDLEPLVRVIAGARHFHGFTNTLAGLVTVVVLCVLPGLWLCERGLVWLDQRARRTGYAPAIDTRIPAGSAVGAALAGTGTHWFLDAVMHADARPFWPWADANLVQGVVSIEVLNGSCLVLALAGIGLMALRARGRNR